jgi:hypothetical protein
LLRHAYGQQQGDLPLLRHLLLCPLHCYALLCCIVYYCPQIPIICNNIKGTFLLADMKVVCSCTHCAVLPVERRTFSPTQVSLLLHLLLHLLKPSGPSCFSCCSCKSLLHLQLSASAAAAPHR